MNGHISGHMTGRMKGHISGRMKGHLLYLRTAGFRLLYHMGVDPVSLRSLDGCLQGRETLGRMRLYKRRWWCGGVESGWTGERERE